MAIPASLKNGVAHTLHVKIAGTSIELYNSPKTINCGYAYDAAGNVTNDGQHSYQYDGENRLVSVDSGATGQYAYDPSNRRYKKVTAGATTHYIWQGSQVIAEYDGSTGASTADYVYSGSRMIAKVSSGVTQYFLSDRLSERLMLNTSSNVIGRMAHLPFGEDFGESGTQEKHHFTTYERDAESSSDYAVNRYYSAGVGRFNSADPYKPSTCRKNPQSLDRYTYVLNKTLDHTDPSGLLLADPNGGWPTSCSLVDGMYWSNGNLTYGIVGFSCGGGVGNVGGGEIDSCEECCVNALDDCKALFFMQMQTIPSAFNAASTCYEDCAPYGVAFGRCFVNCMSKKIFGNLNKIRKFLADFDECVARRSNNSADNHKDCWCPWM